MACVAVDRFSLESYYVVMQDNRVYPTLDRGMAAITYALASVQVDLSVFIHSIEKTQTKKA